MPTVHESAERWLKLDEICDQFETACLAGKQPRVEEFLNDVPPERRGETVRELLKVDVHYRQRTQDQPSVAEYRSRFPDVDSVWLRALLAPLSSRALRESPEAMFPPKRSPNDLSLLPSVPGYEVLELIGHGGMGVVYKARQLNLNRLVALKMVLAGELAGPETLARFRAEARAVAQLQHPNLVQIYEVGEHGGRPYLAFEYIAGGGLDQRLRGEPQPSSAAAKLIKTLANAIQFAHVRGIVHRDLKPANILLATSGKSPVNEPRTAMLSGGSTSAAGRPESLADRRPSSSLENITRSGTELSGDYGFPKISDFGLAKDLESDSQQTKSGAILGTPSYMAPEQATGRARDIGPATDVYALGAIFYEMLTGRPPFRAPTVIETLDQVRSLEPLSLRRLQPTVPRDLETICLKCLQKEPSRRYASAGELADDLDRHLRDEPVSARPVSSTERTWRWCRRHPLVATLAMLLVVVTLGGFSGIFHQWRQAVTLRELAEDNALQSRGQRDEAQQLRKRAEANFRQAEANRLTAEANRQTAEANQQRAEAAREQGDRVLYLRNVNGANAAMLAHNFAHAAALLESCRDDLRNWEWGYSQRLLRLGCMTLSGHTMPTTKGVFTADGQTLITSSGTWNSSAQGELMFWDARTGRLLETRKPHVASIFDLALHPQKPELLTAGFDWSQADSTKRSDLQTGQELSVILEAGNSFALAVSPDGRWLGLAGADGRVRLCDAHSGKVERTLTGHTQNVFAVAFSSDSRRLVSGSRDGSVRFWDTQTGENVRTIAGVGDVRGLSFSPDGELLAAISYTGFVKLWDAEGQTELVSHHARVFGRPGVQFSPDGQWLAVAAGERMLIWDPLTSEVIKDLPGHRNHSKIGTFSSDGRQLVTCGSDRLVHICDLTSEPDGQAKSVQSSKISDFDISPNGRVLATAADFNPLLPSDVAKVLRLWSLDERRELRRMAGHTDWLTCTAFAPDGLQVASGSRDRTLRIWDVATGKSLRMIAAHDGPVLATAYRPDGQLLVSAGADQLLKLWNPQTGELVRTLKGHTSAVNRVVFTSDGHHLISGGERGELRVWPLEGQAEPITLGGHQDSVQALAVSSDQRWLASAGFDSKILLWDFAAVLRERQAAQPTREFQGRVDRVMGLDFSPNGQRLASTSVEYGVTLWDLSTGQPALDLQPPNMLAGRVRFSSDGHRLVTNSHGSVFQWDDRRPAVLSDEEQARQAVAWHTRESQLAEQRGRPFAVLHHLRQLPDSAFVSASLRQRRGNAHALLRNWSAAAADYESLATQDIASNQQWYHAAVLRLLNGDESTYRDLCRGQRNAFSPPPSSDATNAIVWTWCLTHHEPAELEPLVKLAEDWLPKTRTTDSRLSLLNSLGSVLYRAGRFEEAIQRLEQSLQERGKGGLVEDWLFLALAHHRLGHAEEARRWLDQSLADIEQSQPVPKAGQRRKIVGPWERQATQELLLREAQHLITP